MIEGSLVSWLWFGLGAGLIAIEWNCSPAARAVDHVPPLNTLRLLLDCEASVSHNVPVWSHTMWRCAVGLLGVRAKLVPASLETYTPLPWLET